ncbi:MAG: hypothetical protein ACRD0U_17960, partial [Acidimicrobiales bacterium]
MSRSGERVAVLARWRGPKHDIAAGLAPGASLAPGPCALVVDRTLWPGGQQIELRALVPVWADRRLRWRVALS